MTDAVTSGEVDRLRARLERERRARRQAEAIAERGMRELWDINRELVERAGHAASRSEAESTIRLLTARLALVREAVGDSTPEGRASPALDRVAALLGEPVDAPAVTAERAASDVLDGVIERWLRPAAEHGFLLSAAVGPGASRADCDWAALDAVIDAVVPVAFRRAGSGTLEVRIEIDVRVVSLSFQGAVAGVDAETLDVVRRLVEPVGGSVDVADGAIRVTVPDRRSAVSA